MCMFISQSFDYQSNRTDKTHEISIIALLLIKWVNKINKYALPLYNNHHRNLLHVNHFATMFLCGRYIHIGYSYIIKQNQKQRINKVCFIYFFPFLNSKPSSSQSFHLFSLLKY